MAGVPRRARNGLAVGQTVGPLRVRKAAVTGHLSSACSEALSPGAERSDPELVGLPQSSFPRCPATARSPPRHAAFWLGFDENRESTSNGKAVRRTTLLRERQALPCLVGQPRRAARSPLWHLLDRFEVCIGPRRGKTFRTERALTNRMPCQLEP